MNRCWKTELLVSLSLKTTISLLLPYFGQKDNRIQKQRAVWGWTFLWTDGGGDGTELSSCVQNCWFAWWNPLKRLEKSYRNSSLLPLWANVRDHTRDGWLHCPWLHSRGSPKNIATAMQAFWKHYFHSSLNTMRCQSGMLKICYIVSVEEIMKIIKQISLLISEIYFDVNILS